MQLINLSLKELFVSTACDCVLENPSNLPLDWEDFQHVAWEVEFVRLETENFPRILTIRETRRKNRIRPAKVMLRA